MGGEAERTNRHHYDLSDTEITELFKSLDTGAKGELSGNEVATLFARQVSTVRVVGGDDLGKLTIDEAGFRAVVRHGERARHALFEAIDVNKDGVWTEDELRGSFADLFRDKNQLDHFVNHIMSLGNSRKGVTYSDFMRWSVLSQATTAAEVAVQFRTFDLDDDLAPPIKRQAELRASQQLGILTAGAVAGVASRTITAPVERIKVMLQTGRATSGAAATFARVVQSQGIWALWRGNLANCLKIAPAKAIKFGLYENVKTVVCHNPRRPSFSENFLCASFVAATVAVALHPIDTIKTYMSISGNTEKVTIRQTVRDIAGPGSNYLNLFRGVGASVVSAVPFSGTNLATFMYCKQLYKDHCIEVENSVHSPPIWFYCSSAISSTLVSSLVAYPMYSIKVNIQAGSDANATACIRRIWAAHGLAGFYRGMLLHSIKAIPAVAVTYTSFEKAKEFLGIDV